MPDATYTIPDDVMAAELEGEAVILHLKTKRYYRLNATAAVVWKGIQQNHDRATMVRDLTASFDVDAKIAQAELDQLLSDLLDKGLIVE